ncbi:MAG: DUF924 domain-containing protein [Geminicoccaceae bacterium]|nr:DUF924 domain-containing protein [Geminicoccaceae bacterium]
MDDDVRRILDFWFADEARPHWFASTPAFDAECARVCGDLLDKAESGAIWHWCRAARSTLALVLLTDQFPRNMFRGTARAFACDHLARGFTREALDLGFDAELSIEERAFLYLPFEHSENPADQARSVALFERLGDAEKLDYAVRHKVIVDRFGRFPHRNAALGRTSTAEEAAFLEQPNSSF